MIPQISNALGKGFTSKQIIDFLIRKFPSHSAKIKTALASGYTVDQVLKYLGGGRKAVNQDTIPQTEHEKSLGTDVQRREDVNKKALAGGAIAATSLAAPMAAQALQRALPSNLTSMIPQLSQSIQQQVVPNIATNLSNQGPQQPPIGQDVTSVTQPTPIAQPEGIINPKEYLEKLGIKDKVDDLLKRGNSPEQAAAVLGMKGGIGKVRGEIDPELLANIDAYSKEPKPEATEQPKESKPIAKNETVATSHGVGEVKEIRNGQAIIDVNGKLHKVKEEELEASPLPEKDLAALYDELIQGIEGETGEDVSRMVQWAGYNPETNTLQFLPHTGKLYKYSNISPEDAALLTDILSTRKTSGENFIGAWKAGSKSPIGAALSKLIRKLQSERGGKGSEYEETHEPIYSAYEPAVQAKKKKKKK